MGLRGWGWVKEGGGGLKRVGVKGWGGGEWVRKKGKKV